MYPHVHLCEKCELNPKELNISHFLRCVEGRGCLAFYEISAGNTKSL
jgi:hypothetical protein